MKTPTVLTVVIVSLIVYTLAENLGSETCDLSELHTAAAPDATAVIGVVFSLRQEGRDGYGCGEMTEVYPIMEGINWAIDRLNQNSGKIGDEIVQDSYVPGVKLGLRVFETCSRPQLVTAAALSLFPQLAAVQGSCSANNSRLYLGALGEYESRTTAPLAEFLGEYGVPLVSPSSSAPSLSDVTDYPFFLRTVPSDDTQTEVIIEVARQLQWQSFAIIHTDDNYGTEGASKLLAAARHAGLCPKLSLSVPVAGNDPEVYRKTLGRIVSVGVRGVVYFGLQSAATRLVQELRLVSGATSLQWVMSDAVGNNQIWASRYTGAKGIITVTPGNRHMAEFENHWVSLNETLDTPANALYREWYMTAYRCRLAGVTVAPFTAFAPCPTLSEAEKRDRYSQHTFLTPAVLSVYAYASALRNAHQTLCGGTPGLCSRLAGLSTDNFYRSYLRPVNLTFSARERIPTLASSGIEPYNAPQRLQFDVRGDVTDKAYDVWNYNDIVRAGEFAFRKVGRYAKQQLSLNKAGIVMYDSSRSAPLPAPPPSPCAAAGCGVCYTALDSSDISFVHVPGDILIGGMFSVHQERGTLFECGPLDSFAGAQFLEAFLFGLSQVRSAGILPPGVTLGTVAFDDCGSKEQAGLISSGFLTGLIKLEGTNGKPIIPEKASVFVGGQNSPIAVLLAEVLTLYKIPLLGYRATSSYLLNKDRYPYYATPALGVSGQVWSTIMVLKKLNITYIQEIHVPGEYGETASNELRDEGIRQGICVAKSHTYSPDITPEQWSQSLRQKPQAKVVVVFADTPQYIALLKALHATKAKDMVILFGGIGWGRSPFVTKELPASATEGYLTLALQDGTMASFNNYLSGKLPNQYSINPWFNEWYETMMNCSLTQLGVNSGKNACNPNTPITTSDVFVQSEFSALIVNALRAIARGLASTLKQFCGENYQIVCLAFESSQNRAEVLMENILKESFLDDSGSEFSFMNRQGVRKLDVLQIQNGKYVKVGSANPTEFTLSMDLAKLNNLPDLVSSCSDSCTDCVYMNNEQTTILDGDFLVGALLNIHNMGKDVSECGGLKLSQSVQYVEAVRYAIEEVNAGRGPVSLTNVTLGAAILDACSSGKRAANIVFNTHTDNLDVLERDAAIDHSKLVAWMTSGSDVTWESASVISSLATGQLALDSDPDKSHPSYSMVPATTRMALALARFLRATNWKNVNLVVDDNEYTEYTKDSIDEAFKENDICVIKEYETNSDSSMNDLITKLIASPSKVVVVSQPVSSLKKFVTAIQAANDEAKDLFIIVIKSISDSLDAIVPTVVDIHENVIILQSSPYMDAAFQAFLKNRFSALQMMSHFTDPWMAEYYQTLYQCDFHNNFKYNIKCQDLLTNTIMSSPRFYKDDTSANAINGIYAITQALHTTLQDLCGESYNGICEDATSILEVREAIVEHLLKTNFTASNNTVIKFDDSKQLDIGFEFVRVDDQNKTDKVAMYQDNELELFTGTRSIRQVESECGSLCMRCQLNQEHTEKFSYILGDVLIGGLFDVHSQGNTLYSCGGVQQQGAQLVEAFNYAIEYVNSASDMLPGITLGGVAMDTCDSPIRTSSIISNIQSGSLSLEVGSEIVNPADIDAYVGGFSTEVSTHAAGVLSELGIAQVSYGSSSPSASLADGPLFLSSVPGDKQLARAIVALLQRFKVSYVQVVFSDGVYGKSTSKEFSSIAKTNRICIAQSLEYSLNTDLTGSSNAPDILSQMLKKTKASVVVLFLETQFITKFIEQIASDNSAKEKFKYIASETWSNKKAFTQFGDVMTGSLTLGLETSDLVNFDSYLSQKFANTYTRNPWFKDLYQEVFKCSFEKNSSPYVAICDKPYSSISRASGYEQNSHVLFTLNAVLAVAKGIQKAVDSVCGSGGVGLCPEFQISPRRKQLIREAIEEVSFTDPTGQAFEFTDDGSSNRGFHIYTVINVAGNYLYNNVGSYNDTHQLKVDTRLRLDWEISCLAEGACAECPEIRNTVTSPYAKAASSDDLNIAIFLPVHRPNERDPLKCGRLDIDNGFLNVLSFFYALRQVNDGLVTKTTRVSLGGVAYDTCGSSLRAVQNAFSLFAGDGECSKDGITGGSVLAVIAQTSGDAIALKDITAYTSTLLLGTGAITPKLGVSDGVLRTVPSASLQANVVADVLKKMNWLYVATLFSDDEDGKASIEAFLKMSSNNSSSAGICATSKSALSTDTTIEEVKTILSNIDSTLGVKVIVLFTSEYHSMQVVKAVDELGFEGRFTFVAGSRWADNSYLQKYNDQVLGTVSIAPQSSVASGFGSYVNGLTVKDHGAIPTDWFEEFWQQTLECRLENATVVQMQYTKVCTDADRIDPDSLPKGAYIQPTIVATQAVALAIGRIYLNECGQDNIVSCLSRLKNINEEVFSNAKNILWKAPSSNFDNTQRSSFSFTDEGFGNQGYTIFNLQSDGYKEIGNYNQGSLTLNKNSYQSYPVGESNQQSNAVVSQCPLTRTCMCVTGTSGGRTDGLTGATTPRQPQEVNIRANFDTDWGITLTVFSGLGVVITLIILVYFVVYYPLRGGTSVLGYLLLFSIILLYATNFAFILQPDSVICGVRRFCLGFVYALVFSCMLIKIIVNWQLEQADDEYSRPTSTRLLHPASIFFIALGVACVQAVIAAEWIILDPPQFEWVLYNGAYIARCSPSDFHNEELVISCVYVMFLIFLTLIFAVTMWHYEENTRESRWILACTCFTVGIWIVWPIVTCLLEFKFRDPGIIIANLVNATVILLCLYVRKLYLWNKFQKEAEDEDRRSRMGSYISEERKEVPMAVYPNVHMNNVKDGVDSAAYGSNLYVHAGGPFVEATGTIPRSTYVNQNGAGIIHRGYDPQVQGADVEY